MMGYKTCSVNKVIAQIYRDFKPSNSGWVDDAVEWIGDAISIMRVCQGFTEQNKKFKVIDYRVKLPCNIDMLLGIEYQRHRLEKTNAINQKNKCSCLNNLVCHPSESYSLNPNYIITTFKEGEITLYWNGIELDCDGFPYILDDAVYREALTWYILMKMCLRGFKHQTIDYKLCRDLWLQEYPRAQNRFRMRDIDDAEVFKKSWLGLVKPTNMTNQFFNSAQYSQVQEDASNPGSLLQTFPVIEDTDIDTIIDNID